MAEGNRVTINGDASLAALSGRAVRRGARGARGQNPLGTLTAAPRARATSVDVRPRDAALAEPSRVPCRAASSTRFQDAIEHVARHPAAVVMPEGKLVEV